MSARRLRSSGSTGSRSASVTSAVYSVSPGRPAVTHASRSAEARPRCRNDGATPTARISRRPWSSVGPATASPTTSVPSTAAATLAPSRIAAPDEGVTGERVGGRDDARREREPLPRRSVGMDDRRPADARSRREPRLSRPRTGRERIPPAAVPRHLQQPRHDQPPHDADRLERARLGDGLRGIQLQPGIRGVLERRGEWRLAVSGALGRPALAPRDRRGGRHLAMRAGQPDEAPAPWHDPVRVVAAATGRQPATAGGPVCEPIDQPRRLAHRGRGHAQVRERIPRVRVGSVLRHDEVRPERGGQFGEQHLDRRRAMPPPRSRARAAR